jgi:putative transposase
MTTNTRRYNCSRNKKIKKLPVFETEKQLKKFLELNFTESLKQMIRLTVKTMVKEEMEFLREGLEEKMYFNGHYQRQMLSSFGKVADIPIPRFRQGFGSHALQSLNVFDKEQDKFMKLIEQMHLLGISQRKIKSLAQTCFGINLSLKRVGEINKELAQKEECNINSQAIADEFEYLLLDGIWEKTKGYGWDSNKSVLLCALGIRADGTRKIIGFSFARREDNQTWGEFVGQLKQRGLTGKKLQLVIIDDTAAIKNAVERYYPATPIQGCIAHKARNVLAKTKFKHKKEMADDLRTIWNAQDKKQALANAKTVCKKWYLVQPEAVNSLKFNLEYCLTFFDFPKDLWQKIRTTNILEREFREVRRRIKVFDSSFNHPESTQNYANNILTG